MLYVNPGYIELMNGDVKGATVNNSGKLFFYNTKNTCSLKIPDTKDIWLKVNTIFARNNIRIYTSVISEKYIGVRLNEDGTFNDWNYFAPGDNGNAIFNIGTLLPDTEYEFMFHIKADKAAGLKEIYINGLFERSYTGNINDGNPFSEIEIQADSSKTLFRNLIVADFDISDYHIAPVEIKDFETDFKKQTDGSLKATIAGQYITMHIDTDDLKAKMQKVVENAEIVGLNVGAFNVGYDSSIINALKSSVNGTDAETIKLVNANAAGKILLVNPANSKAWTLSELESDTFKLTTEKV